MKKYKIYFEVFGKKMQTEVFASSQKHAKKIIREKIKFHKIKEISLDPDLEYLKKMFGYNEIME